jgi:hypothetical protein
MTARRCGMMVFLCLTAYCASADDRGPGVYCKAEGANAHCQALSVEKYKLLPLWILGKQQAFGEKFHTPAPRDCTMLIVLQPSDEDPNLAFRSRLYVKRIDHKARFFEIDDEERPKDCVEVEP